ncbi:Protein of unknown function, DUF485 [Geoalkalibacter ferrihydriticus]|uniref:DUF485 domain-containing protein n=2 Tax=Geoalkalibacter ferrihydriticus TaxID=392333 RepID=A0A0C2DX01_9BACT|nr:DUF485 domain-containing protein [Geoalkalibacter ferrihydriticus]KIH77994.1 hypothetical protein GFER_05180 [Geoalkalibacter ferrihydriticus DSM 17813]SDM33650.1 Protein of unknown function, DUF485 [Geoalkalibacter ferrihydriticus]
MGHGPAVKLGKDNAAGYKAKIGITMFFVYTSIYFIFVLINITKPTLMQIQVFGLNLSVVYGISLIVGAFLLALVYNHFCTQAENRLNK